MSWALLSTSVDGFAIWILNLRLLGRRYPWPLSNLWAISKSKPPGFLWQYANVECGVHTSGTSLPNLLKGSFFKFCTRVSPSGVCILFLVGFYDVLLTWFAARCKPLKEKKILFAASYLRHSLCINLLYLDYDLLFRDTVYSLEMWYAAFQISLRMQALCPPCFTSLACNSWSCIFRSS